MKFILDHTVILNHYWWDILMLIVTLVACITLFFYCRKKIKDMKDLKQELEDKLSNVEDFESLKESAAPLAQVVNQEEKEVKTAE